MKNSYQNNPKIAETEGWVVSNNAKDLLEIQRFDEKGIFSTDEDAMRFVLKHALSNSPYHKSAILMVLENNPIEGNYLLKSVLN